jgi:hypothetical protein
VSSILIPGPGCGALFPPYDGPTHRCVGGSATCWAIVCSLTNGSPPDTELLRQSHAQLVTPASLPRPECHTHQRSQDWFTERGGSSWLSVEERL